MWYKIIEWVYANVERRIHIIISPNKKKKDKISFPVKMAQSEFSFMLLVYMTNNLIKTLFGKKNYYNLLIKL